MEGHTSENFNHIPGNISLHCYIVNVTAENAYWQSENPLTQALPLLIWQLALGILINRVLFYLLRPFNVPRIVTDILAGILIGPSFLSKYHFFAKMYPLRAIMVVETLAYWVMTFHLFLTGLEIDLGSIARLGKNSIRFAIFVTVLPFLLGICLFFVLIYIANDTTYRNTGCVFWAVALSVTSYPVISRILTEQKLLHTDIGRLTTAISLVNELATWAFLTFLIPARIGVIHTVFSVISTAGFAAICVTVVRPCLTVIIKKTVKGDTYNEYFLSFIVVFVSLFSLISDILGTTSIVGAFLFGLIMPDRVLASVLLEKFDDFVTTYMLPLYFTSMGRRVDVWNMNNWDVSLLMMLLCCVVKFVSIYVASRHYKISHKDIYTLGVLLNSKGLLAVVILNMGFDKKYLHDDAYVIMIIATMVMTGVVPYIVSTIYNPTRRCDYKQRTIQNTRPDTEFRILTCFQSTINVTGMINLLDFSNPTKDSPLCVFSMHIVELTGRASSTLIVHQPGRTKNRKYEGYSEQIVDSLYTYANFNDQVSMNPLTALSPFATMHEDICSVAEDKRVSFLILPFHKLPTPDGKLEEDGSTSYRGVNLNVLANAPCTVGIFVDRGFGAIGESNLTVRQILMLFMGGPDDREALSYAWRMGMGHGISLKVVRFIPADGANLKEDQGYAHQSQVSEELIDAQRRLDDEFVNEFRLKSEREENMSYEERVLNDDEDLIAALKEMHHIFDLYIVGKGEGMKSPLTAALMDWCEYPELGALGDLLVTSSFAQGSVLVVQQYSRFGDENDEDDEGFSVQRREYFSNWRPSLS